MSLVCLSSANCLRAFLCIIFRRVFLLGRQPCRPIWCSVRGLFWVEPVLLNRCMVLATVLQLSFRVLAIFLQPTASLCRATILFFRFSESSLPWGAMLNFQWPVWKSESDNTKFNTPAPHSHLRPCNTNESHDTGERKWLIGPNLDIFT